MICRMSSVSRVVTTQDGERTETMEHQAKLRGQHWVNHAYKVDTN